jgi:hypothetical protein
VRFILSKPRLALKFPPLSPKNVLYWSLYRTAKLTGSWPDDGWFLYLAGLVADVEREAWEAKQISGLQSAFGGMPTT